MNDEELQLIVNKTRYYKKEVSEKTSELKRTKALLEESKVKLRIAMKTSGYKGKDKKFDGVELREKITFLKELFRLENKELGKQLFVKEQTLIPERIVVDFTLSNKNLKLIKEKYPEKYKSCLEEETPGLYGL